MLFNDFYSLQLMRGGLDALALQQDAILQNLANVSTPGYKAKSVSFDTVLRSERSRQAGEFQMKAVVSEDTNPMRPDENTVDPDKESLKLYQNYVQQLALYDRIGESFTNLRYVFNQFTK